LGKKDLCGTQKKRRIFKKERGGKSHLSGQGMPSIPSLGKEWVGGFRVWVM